jgi:hypothetical protein
MGNEYATTFIRSRMSNEKIEKRKAKNIDTPPILGMGVL